MASAGRTGLAARQRWIVWFRGADLRLHDNAVLQRATEAARKGGADVYPVFVFDWRFLGDTKMGGYRARFLIDSVLDLKERLRSVGSDLLVGYGKPEDVLPLLEPHKVLAQRENTHEELLVEREVRQALERLGGDVETLNNSTLYSIEDIPFRSDFMDLPNTFTPARKVPAFPFDALFLLQRARAKKESCAAQRVEARCTVRDPLPSPGKGDLQTPELGPEVQGTLSWEDFPRLRDLPLEDEDELARAERENTPEHQVMAFKGGETAGLERLREYVWGGKAETYLETRNGMLGRDYSTKLAPWLSHGCLSPRQVAKEVRRYEGANHVSEEARKSLYWIVFELTWRDYFKWLFERHGNALFSSNGICERSEVEWTVDNDILQRWKEGLTGWPLVDANMRELLHTGFMSNRGRQNVASFLALDMNVDWRRGAEHFERFLIDFDVHSNYGNWISAAALLGGRVNRFNIAKQSKQARAAFEVLLSLSSKQAETSCERPQYDPDGEYIRAWVPELRQVPREHIHEPFKMPRGLTERFNCQGYPKPPRSRFNLARDGRSRRPSREALPSK